ncbi:caffeoylshikimate esterase-like [Phalaenopsis equestris]|uniref:caffeoylshikimate esterase-like n=1 Tax=Phalaenopsis equestris TaxID=78828 RepID=UPI0009E443BE|nr:caffeoylshikimate esterase-like [Phalaenopsis equestris]
MAGGIGSARYEEEFTTGSNGVRLFACRWLPEKQDPKALIFLCHGYGMECSISMRVTGTRLAKAGFAVYGMDYRGHGKSAGLQGYIPSFDELVNDCSNYFTSVSEMILNRNKKRFLLGESMGGAVALMLHRKKPLFWHGAVLVAPMCKIAEEIKPHPLVVKALTKLSSVIPKWKIVPTKDITESAFKNPDWREEIRSNPYCYKGKPRLKTAKELLMISIDIEKNLHQVSLPFLVIHGGADIVTDPSVSQALYDTAASEDKTFKLYPGMWHALTSAESQQNLHLVFSDIVLWLDERSMKISSSSEMETTACHNEKKMRPSKSAKTSTTTQMAPSGMVRSTTSITRTTYHT